MVARRVQLMATCLCDAFFDDVARATVEVLEHRLRRGRGEVRPLLAEPGALAQLRERRMPLYERADLIIDAGNLSPQGIAVRIHGTLEGRAIR